MTRRLSLSLCLLMTAAMAARGGDIPGKPILPWKPGTLDIHQISTGRGNAGFKGLANLASDSGHIVLRVAPRGKSFRVIIVDDRSESYRVTKVFGPYSSK